MNARKKRSREGERERRREGRRKEEGKGGREKERKNERKEIFHLHILDFFFSRLIAVRTFSLRS